MATTIAEIDPNGIYTVEEVAPVLRAKPATIRGWVRSGQLKSCRRETSYAPMKFTGQMIRDYLGVAPVVVPVVESERALDKRARAEAERFARLRARKTA